MWRGRRRLLRHWGQGVLARAGGRTPVHVLHIYKTGGTALKHALADVQPTHGFKLFTHKHSVTLTQLPRGHKVIAFLRDPVDRFVSGFYDRKREGRPRYFTAWSPAEAETFARFATPNALGEALAAGGEAAAAAAAALASLDRIRQPLSHWLGDEGAVLARRDDILLIGRQESLAADFERMKGLINLPAALQLPVDPAEAHRAGAVDRYLSPLARDRLRRAYAADYIMLELLCSLGLLAAEAGAVDVASPAGHPIDGLHPARRLTRAAE